jgi:hypothetical protein
MGPRGATGPRGEFNHTIGSLSRLIISSPQGLKLDNMGRGSAEFASHKLTGARVYHLPDESGQLVVQGQSYTSNGKQVTTGDLHTYGDLQLFTNTNRSLVGLRSEKAQGVTGSGGVMFMADNGNLRFQGGNDSHQWSVVGQNGYSQFSIQNTASLTGSTHYTTKGTIGSLDVKKTVSVNESIYLGKEPMGVAFTLGLAHQTSPQVLIQPHVWTDSCRLGLLLGDDTGFIERVYNKGMTIQDPNGIWLHSVRGKVQTIKNVLDAGNGDSVIAGNLNVQSAISVGSQVRPSRFQGSIIASGSPSDDMLVAFNDLSSANVQLGSGLTNGFIQTVSNRRTYDVPLQLNTKGGAVVTEHNVLDDNHGGMNVSGKLKVGGLDCAPARVGYFKITGLVESKPSMMHMDVCCKGDGWAVSESKDHIVLPRFEPLNVARWFEIHVQLSGVVPAGTQFSVQVKDTIVIDHNQTSVIQKRTMSLFALVQGVSYEHISVELKGFAMVSSGLIKVVEVV